MAYVELDYAPREWQQELHDACSAYRFVVAIVHRRAGKTWGALAELVKQACKGGSDFRGAFVAPSLVQAKRIAWKRLGALLHQIPGVREYKADARFELPNGAEVMVLGVDKFDSNRGIGLNFVVLDETALFPYGAWDEVIRPTLSDTLGHALFIGTLDEGGILLDDLDEYARGQRDPDWHALSFDVHQTGAIEASEIESLSRTMSEEAFAREYLCRKVGARGAYYARQMSELQAQGRITRVPPLDAVVHVCSDLGIRDSTSLWLYQQVGAEVRWLQSYENEGEQAAFYAQWLLDWADKHKLKLGTVYLPHDGIKRELTSGVSVQDILRQYDLEVETIQTNQIGLDRGIEAVRQVLKNSWFDAVGTADGRKALRAYRRSYNVQTSTLRDTPVHDWSSHLADAMRTGALAIKQLGPQGRRQYEMNQRRGYGRPRSFMGTA